MHVLPFPVAAVADVEVLGARLAGAVAEAFAGGLPWFVLRAKRSSTAERVALGRLVLARCPGVFLTVHGDEEARRALGAPGLHLPSAGFDAAAVRRSHPGVLLGVSCHGAAEVRAAEAAGADYGFLSPAFPPTSKASALPALGEEGFRAAARGVRLPLLALGGLTPARLALVASWGAAGAAVLGDLFLAPDVAGRAAAYRRAWPRSRGELP